ncbi:auxin-induced protein PCNT115 [Physcomitrium patens]|uniref:NADP-dependent oxidoreductase domain-containing protein n=1 Tax=Physcomitrium patens TaxID=3218 RepID=A0A2K1JR44_PHYPA|nr:auxin-induced protein PCNT115-like [Physcomitrium patens]PNR44001.1 hypothetical protein PHYPA_016384 [Physcomitrium patens]|eukprot:XP_024390284.1 auxin-induced protein PCNT115-like [Physcomitrella patens]
MMRSVAALVPGRADAAGTAQYAHRVPSRCGNGHFRILPTRTEGAGDVTVSSLGVGTYLGPETDAADDEYVEAMTKALAVGVNVLDTAVNYRSTRSERAVRRAISEGIRLGSITREQVIVCTKGGYLTFGNEKPADPRRWVQETYVKTGLFTWSDFVAGCHCMTPAYLKNQLDRSRENLGLETVDVYYIHNPETQLSAISRETFYTRIREAFGALEEACSEGKLSVYGTATWNGFRVAPENRGHLSLEELVAAAREVGGDEHHFRVVQLPYNLRMQDAATINSQLMKGKRMSLLSAAQQLGVSVVASASLMQAILCKGLAEETRTSFSELGKNATDAQCALQFVRTTPGILTALAGMRTMAHVEENTGILSYPAVPMSGSVA